MSAVAIGRTPARIGSRPMLRRALWTLDIAVLAAALVAFASHPTGAPTPDGVVPGDGRLVVMQSVGSARVLVAARPQRFELIVAVRRQKGWFGVRAGQTTTGSIAWAGTSGARDVPALSAVFGTASGPLVRITWADGSTQEVAAASDGIFLAARAGHVASTSVVMMARSGHVISEIRGP
jgi:hypothetical protein